MVDHLNGNKSDNSIANLEFVTPSENARRAVASKRAAGGDWSKNVEKCGHPIKGRSKSDDEDDPASWTWYPSMTAAATELSDVKGISQSKISKVVKGKRASCGNMVFKRAPAGPLPGEEWFEIRFHGYNLTTSPNQYNGLAEDRTVTLWELMPFLDPAGGDRRANANKRARDDDDDDDGDY